MLNWYVGPWVWDASTPGLVGWRPPTGCAGLDLRSLPEQSQQGGTPGQGLFWGDVAPASLENRRDYTHLGSGSWYDLKPTGAVRNAIPRRPGYSPKGDDLVGVILDLLTDGADPDGLDGPRPLVPTVEGRLELHCGQKHHERFRWGRFHTSGIRHLLRKEFQQLFADAKAGKLKDAEHHRRVLDYWCEKYGVEDWREFVPPALLAEVPGRLPHETTIMESFNTADSDTLGPDLSWTELAGDIDVVSNQARSTLLNTVCLARADSDLSSDDHYAQASTGTSTNLAYSGVIARKDSSTTQTYYLAQVAIHEDTLIVYKAVAGAETQIGSTSSFTIGPSGGTLKIYCDGSTIKGYFDGVEKVSTTDSAITGNTRGGLKAYKVSTDGGYVFFDSFEAADLAAGGGILYTQLERGIRGLMRGMWTGRVP